MYYSIEIGGSIVTLRKARGLSQEQLAEKAGISVGWLREIEHDCANVARDNVDRIAKALDVPVWALHSLPLKPDAVWAEQHELQALLGLAGKGGAGIV